MILNSSLINIKNWNNNRVKYVLYLIKKNLFQVLVAKGKMALKGLGIFLDIKIKLLDILGFIT